MIESPPSSLRALAHRSRSVGQVHPVQSQPLDQPHMLRDHQRNVARVGDLAQPSAVRGSRSSSSAGERQPQAGDRQRRRARRRQQIAESSGRTSPAGSAGRAADARRSAHLLAPLPMRVASSPRTSPLPTPCARAAPPPHDRRPMQQPGLRARAPADGREHRRRGARDVEFRARPDAGCGAARRLAQSARRGDGKRRRAPAGRRGAACRPCPRRSPIATSCWPPRRARAG